MADKAIEVLLDEKRNFPPPKEFKKSANLKSAARVQPGAEKSPGFLGQGRQRAALVQALEESSGMEMSVG